jgi:RNA polymerase I-specific transcription initiation factor RRN6
VVDFYSFQKGDASFTILSSRQGSFTISLKEGEKKQRASLRSLIFLPCKFVSDDTYGQDAKYFQLWALTSSLGFSAALFQVHLVESGKGLSLLLMAPDRKISHFSRGRRQKSIDDQFLVHNDSGTEDEENQTNDRYLAKFKVNDDIRFRLNWRSVFEHAFINEDPLVETENVISSMSDLLAKVTDSIARGVESQVLPMDTIANISGFIKSSDELDQAASVLRGFFSSLDLDLHAPDEEHALVLSHLTNCPETKDFISADSEHVDLSKVHETLVSYWMASLPLEVPNSVRLAKFKIIRQVGVDLALNSFGISLQNKASSPSNAPPQSGANDEHEKNNDGRTRESFPALTSHSSQPYSWPGNEIYSSLPTSSRTPSLYSHATSGSELKEDPVTSRLRQYAVAIKARPDAGPSSLLSHWPSVPGADPATYSYEAAQQAAAAGESGAESEYRDRKEEARRRRRTEKFLRQDRARARAAEANSQPMVILPSGTQPQVSHPAFSSQVVDELPVTQPDRGMFGSRTAEKGTKHKKQRKAGF